MKKKEFISKILSGILIVIISGCEKVIEPKDLPDQDPRIVLNSVLKNDSAIIAHISSSKSIISGKSYKMIENAACDVYEDDHFVEQLKHTGGGYYTGSVKPVTSKKYTLKVTATGYNGVEGSTSLGKNVVLNKAERFDTINHYLFEPSYNFGTRQIYGSLKFIFRLLDDITITNYYSITPQFILYDSIGRDISEPMTTYIYLNNTAPYSSGITGGFSLDFNDGTLVNGREIEVDVSIGLNLLKPPAYSVKSVGVKLVLSNISEDLYKYKSTLNEQSSTRASIFAEPVIVHNNVKNGMGIVGSMNSNSVLIGNFVVKKQ
jgi:hypothetical protein